MIKEYNEEIGRQLYQKVVEFIIKHEVAHVECIFQTDAIIIESPNLLCDVAEVVGYYDFPEDE